MPQSDQPRGAPLGARTRLVAGVVVGLVCAGIGLLLRSTDLVERLELAFLDLRIRPAAGTRAPADDILLMQVKDADLEAVKERWPWPLSVNVTLAQVLREAGARALVVDAFHFDRGKGTDDGAVARTPEEAEQIEREAAEAEDYAAELEPLGAVLAYELAHVETFATPPRVKAARERLTVPGLVASEGAPRWPVANFPVHRVTAGARALGFANVVVDADGVVRRALPLARLGETTVPSLPLALAFATGDATVVGGAPRVRGKDVPLDDRGTFLIDFRSREPGRAYPRLAPATVLKWATERRPDGSLPPEAAARVRGKTVIFGVNLAGQSDTVATPIAAVHDGPEVQATILDNLLHGGIRVRAAGGWHVLFTVLAGVLVGLLAMAPRGKVLPHLLVLVALGAVVAMGFLTFAAGQVLDLFVPLAVGVLAWIGTTAIRLLTEGRYNRWLEGAFSRYLAPSVIDALKRDPSKLELGGRTRDVTVLFSDVAGFTTLSEKLSSAQVGNLLNEYLTRHCDAVFATEGVVDKFIGDAVMAFWNDPVDQPDHALRACRTALAVQAAMPGLEPIWRGMGLPEFKVRIGLNTGQAKLGNMGSRQRFDYTALGDTVNLASRLEGANKAFGTQILIGESVRRAAGDAILAKPLARLVVVGKKEAVQVFELVALAAQADDETHQHVAAFTHAVDEARAGRIAEARAAWNEALELAPDDGACAWFGGILERLEKGEEPTPWSGTLTMGSK